MPIYTYKCKCENVFDDIVDFDQKTTKCPKCGKKAKRNYEDIAGAQIRMGLGLADKSFRSKVKRTPNPPTTALFDNGKGTVV